MHKNKSAQEIREIIDKRKHPDHKAVDSFCLAILFHGRENEVTGTDSERVKISNITTQFDGENCPDLAGLLRYQKYRGSIRS